MIDQSLLDHSLRRRLTWQPHRQVKAHRAGRSHNEWGFSNRMLDTTVALMAAK